jgi:hypothetical protein
MRAAIRSLFFVLCLVAFLPLTAYAQDKDKKKFEPQSETGAAIKELLTTWWLWVGLIVIAGLLGYLYYLRNHQDDD